MVFKNIYMLLILFLLGAPFCGFLLLVLEITGLFIYIAIFIGALLVIRFWGDKVFLFGQKIKLGDKKTEGKLYDIVKNQCYQMGITEPKLYVTTFSEPNLLSFKLGNKGVLIVDYRLIELLETFELQEVVHYGLVKIQNSIWAELVQTLCCQYLSVFWSKTSPLGMMKKMIEGFLFVIFVKGLNLHQVIIDQDSQVRKPHQFALALMKLKKWQSKQNAPYSPAENAYLMSTLFLFNSWPNCFLFDEIPNFSERFNRLTDSGLTPSIY